MHLLDITVCFLFFFIETNRQSRENDFIDFQAQKEMNNYKTLMTETQENQYQLLSIFPLGDSTSVNACVLTMTVQWTVNSSVNLSSGVEERKEGTNNYLLFTDEWWICRLKTGGDERRQCGKCWGEEGNTWTEQW